MKKFISFALALSMIVTAVSCGNKNNEAPVQQEEISVSTPVVTQTMYKENRLILPEDFGTFSGMGYADGIGTRIVCTDNDNNIRILTYDSDFQQTDNLIIGNEENERDSVAEIHSDGSVTLMIMFAEYDGEINEDTFQDFIENAEVRFEVREYDANGGLDSSFEIDTEGYFTFSQSFIQGFARHGDRYVFTTNDYLLYIDNEGNVIESEKNDGHTVYIEDSEGKLIVITMSGYAYIEGDSIAIPSEKQSFGENIYSMGNPVIGSGDYKLYLRLSDGIYGMTYNDELIKIVDYVSSKIYSSEIYGFTPVDEGKFIIYGAGTSGRYFSSLTVRPDDYIENKQNVVVGVSGSIYDDVRSLVTEYNKQSDDYNAELKSYKDNDKLTQAILSGDSPDVYRYYEFGVMQKYADFGAFADMYELSETYGGFGKDDILDNVTQAFEYKNGLYGITDKFNVDFYVLNRDIAGEDFGGWDIDTFLDTAENIPEDMYLSDYHTFNDRDSIFRFLCSQNLSEWIDFRNAECNFDNERFIRVLNFCRDANIPEQYDWQEWYADTSKKDQAIWEEENHLMVKNNKALMSKMPYLGDYYSFIVNLCSYGFDIDSAVLASIPNSDKSGKLNPNNILSVLNSGKCQEGGWDFVNYFMSYKKQAEVFSSFPTRKDAFETVTNKEINDLRNPNATHKAGFGEYTVYVDCDLTDEQFDKIRKYVLSCSDISGVYPEIDEMLNEEFQCFINGESTAEQCSKMIQNRVSIYLSENS